MNIEEKDNVYKISMPLIADEEIRNIDNNFEDIVNEFTKSYVKEKDLVIAQHIMQKQQNKISQLESDNYELNNRINELENRFNEFVKVEQTVDSINFALPVEVAKEFDRTMTNIDLNNENKRLKAREQKLIEKLEEESKQIEHDILTMSIDTGSNYSLNIINEAKGMKKQNDRILSILKG